MNIMLIFYKKDKNNPFSIKVITIAIIIVIVLFFLPKLTPLVISVLFLWIYYEEKERQQGIIIQNHNTHQLEILLHRAYAKDGRLIDGPVKEITEEELMQEYKEKHGRNEYELNQLKGKYDREKLHDINTIKDELEVVKTFYEAILHYSKDVIPKYKLKEGLELAENKLKEIEILKGKKSYTIKDLIEIKDIFDTSHYFGGWMVLERTRYFQTRKFSDEILLDIKMLSKKIGIKLEEYPSFYFFWSQI